MTQRTALVLGATGGIGGAVARNLRAKGWHVRALHRDAGARQGQDGLDWHQGDAMQAADVLRAAQGVELIVHAVNPAGYRNWGTLVLPMMDNTIAAARAVGARILLPGTVYNYGPADLAAITETTPQRPITRKGKIRVEMERRLRASGLPVIVLRAGDFFGPGAGNTWFAQGLVKPGAPLQQISNPSKAGVAHQWAYLPDLAECMVRLVDTAPAQGFQNYHFAGHWDADGTAMIAAIRKATGNPDLPVKRLPWTLLWMLSPFMATLREMMEMRYLWVTPARMTNQRLVEVLGSEPQTPLEEAVRTTLDTLGCLTPVQGKQRLSHA